MPIAIWWQCLLKRLKATCPSCLQDLSGELAYSAAQGRIHTFMDSYHRVIHSLRCPGQLDSTCPCMFQYKETPLANAPGAAPPGRRVAAATASSSPTSPLGHAAAGVAAAAAAGMTQAPRQHAARTAALLLKRPRREKRSTQDPCDLLTATAVCYLLPQSPQCCPVSVQ
jgi:hypothetical protein